jgi:hypothetical protein
MTSKLQSDQTKDTLLRLQSNLRGSQRVLWNSLLERLERSLTSAYHLMWPGFCEIARLILEQSYKS